jgi:tetratricopeptide (TPR) repeat protein
MNDLALADIEKAIHLNPNNGLAYYRKATFHFYSDFVKSIDNNHKAVSIDRGKSLNYYLRNLGWEYFQAGFIERSIQYYREALKLDGDSAVYFNFLGFKNHFQGNYSTAIDFFQRSIALGYLNAYGYLGASLLREGRHKEALEAYENWIEYLNEINRLSFENTHRIAYAYWINGFEKEAEEYFDMQIEYCLGDINSNRIWASLYFTYYDLAGVYAFRGEKEKAYENLRIFNQIEEVPYWMPGLIRSDELFESIRDEPEFQQIVRDVEAKYQASHERVRQWLEGNDML